MTEKERKEFLIEIAVLFHEWAEELRIDKKRVGRLNIGEFLRMLADYDEELVQEFRKAFWNQQ
jgi:hypothetical protein